MNVNNEFNFEYLNRKKNFLLKRTNKAKKKLIHNS